MIKVRTKERGIPSLASLSGETGMFRPYQCDSWRRTSQVSGHEYHAKVVR